MTASSYLFVVLGLVGGGAGCYLVNLGTAAVVTKARGGTGGTA